ncbi:hypothetical protein GDO81_000911 [Engystomops pustulosus]|uniref:CRC domain-containing protein n=1 Tax=Engystomops pustulosus TaxID=76066 RepID=A0AAV7D861_ENGPU|nr:hypothetical protein GDO81_000911 [Engystomops pustulosus]
MSVVSAEVNSALPDEIMETGMSIADEDSIEAITISSPMAEEVPMETELEEIVEVSSSGECVTTSLVKEAFTAPSNHGGHLAAVVSVASNTSPAPSATAMKTVLQSGIHKLGAPLSGQVILNKTSELATSNRMIKQEKVYVTTLGKGSNPIVFIPQNAMSSTQKATQVQHVDSKGTPQQIKLVTIGGQSGVSSLTSAQLLNTAAKSSLHGQQIQNVQMAKPMVVNATPVRMSVPIVPAQAVKQVAPKPINAPIVTTSQPQQRLLMPATPLAQIQPNLTNLPVLTPAPGTGNMGYAVLPAQYVTQLQQSSYVSIASNAGIPGTQSSQNQPRVPLNGIMPSEATSRPRKPCNCTKSLCLKLYCDCFANGEFCNNCNCTNCYNNLEHENERQKAIKVRNVLCSRHNFSFRKVI